MRRRPDFRKCCVAGLALVLCGVSGAGMAQDASGSHRGGTLKLVASGSAGTLDPQINYSAQYIDLFANVYDGLTGFRKVRGKGGNDVVADLAEALPVPRDGGRTWVFTLRQGVRFSNGREVTVADVVASMRRLFRVGSPTAGAFYSAIAGADLCMKEAARCTLERGVVADTERRTVTFHLMQPDNEFLQKLAFIHASILPAETPDHDVGNVPATGTGPYRVVSYDPNGGMKLERNPWFRLWSEDAQPDGYADHIDYSFGLPDESAVTAVENGQYDWMYDQLPLDRLGELGSRFTAQTHVSPHPVAYFAPLNVNIPPFSEEKARQAVNYAMGRRAMVIFYGGTALARPLCDMIPSAIEGHTDACPYSRDADADHPAARWEAPDLERARQLVRESGTAGQKVTVVVANGSVDLAMGNYMRNTLEEIGYKASVRPLSPGVMFPYIQNSSNHVQISLKSWAADYPSPSNFLDALLGCENFHPGSDSSINMPGFCDRTIQAIMDRAKSDVSLSPEQTLALWRQADELVMRRSPIAPVIEMNVVSLTSRRLGNFFYTNVYGLLFSKVWVQ
ncbi:ABC transporter substrate-binding protein [Acetobacter fallax]|uniref:ABC transporter substrate-binding protein n=1 Tax=Acetobacter fallax TaxID=1737473 RepID=A0ABX0K9Q4_9PROT|nr:ABC transporter substrate-binding protein [Acetobacter fallax]NHO33144.1 ABC transporter substrate-binding protein [Acetobacter fallax]NHO36835.1 ABC transporter substrate-binding protein [Acetobacter fallax]